MLSRIAQLIGNRSRSVNRFQRIVVPNVRSMVVVTKTEAGSSSEPLSVLGNESSAPPSLETMNTSASLDQEVNITPTCYARIKNLVDKRENLTLNDLYLRVYVDAGGCSGFQYKFELTEDAVEAVDDNEDVVFEKEGVRVVIDEASLELIRGSTLDFVQEMIKSSFVVIDNPQSESACGCGSSFAVKNFATNPALD